jgi:hypothetical protein
MSEEVCVPLWLMALTFCTRLFDLAHGLTLLVLPLWNVSVFHIFVNYVVLRKDCCVFGMYAICICLRKKRLKLRSADNSSVFIDRPKSLECIPRSVLRPLYSDYSVLGASRQVVCTIKKDYQGKLPLHLLRLENYWSAKTWLCSSEPRMLEEVRTAITGKTHNQLKHPAKRGTEKLCKSINVIVLGVI